jgi:acyl-CoA thioesterase-1
MIAPPPVPTSALPARRHPVPDWARWLAAGLALGTLAGCGGGEGPPAAPALAPPLGAAPAPLATPGRWVVLGSSTAAGVGASPGQGWVAQVAAAVAPLQVTVINLARGGLISTEALPLGAPVPAGQPGPDPRVNLDRALVEAPRLLLLSFPSNDTALGLPPEQTLAHLQLLRDRAAAATPPAVAILLSTQPRDAFDAAQRAQAEELDRLSAQAFGPCFVRTRSALSDGQGRTAAAYGAGDGIHLNDVGHALVAERVLERLRSGECVRLNP